ncbi:Methylthioribose-1-phosphate isomerase [Frankliniella fusca]|uniref:Methylthioribose-1-phosphate isomerase n=1 Tax=Frankliniella fusca TaxID=407009 RepID=A0AAE1HEZ0_9NEOP|nr:Methylthioribose-1-phosphate isomerase [Frankliniella fusca]
MQRLGESVHEWIADLRRLAPYCDFDVTLAGRLKLQLTRGALDPEARAKLNPKVKTYTLARCIEVLQSYECGHTGGQEPHGAYQQNPWLTIYPPAQPGQFPQQYVPPVAAVAFNSLQQPHACQQNPWLVIHPPNLGYQGQLTLPLPQPYNQLHYSPALGPTLTPTDGYELAECTTPSDPPPDPSGLDDMDVDVSADPWYSAPRPGPYNPVADGQVGAARFPPPPGFSGHGPDTAVPHATVPMNHLQEEDEPLFLFHTEAVDEVDGEVVIEGVCAEGPTALGVSPPPAPTLVGRQLGEHNATSGKGRDAALGTGGTGPQRDKGEPEATDPEGLLYQSTERPTCATPRHLAGDRTGPLVLTDCITMAKVKVTPKKKRRLKPLSSLTKNFKGQLPSRQFQLSIYKVYSYFRREKLNQGPLRPVQQIAKRTCDALGIGGKLLGRVKRIGDSGGVFETPGKRTHKKKVRRNVDTFVMCAIRNVIYELHRKRLHVTIKVLLDKIKERGIDFRGGKETLRKVLHDLGFEFKKKDGTRLLKEKPRITLLRLEFLRRFRKAYLEGKKYRVYLDETWCFLHGSGLTRTWQDKDIRSCPTRKISSGGRYIIIHAGGRKGFVPGAGRVWSSQRKPQPGDDYHGDMNGEMFKRWFSLDLVPNLDEPSIIIMDNAKYHFCQAT